MLQELLNLGLVDIGSDDSRFVKLEAAAKGLVQRLKAEPALLIPTTLVAIDTEVDENEPIFSVVEELVIAEWKTLRNTHVNRPRELLRAIIIHSLSIVAQGNPEVAGLVWHTSISLLNHNQARFGKEADLVRALIGDMGKQAEAVAAERMAVVPLPPKKRRRKESRTESDVRPKAFAKLKVNDVLTGVARSAGPQYPPNTPLESANPHWSNVPQWSHEFVPKMSATLVEAVNMGMERVATTVSASLEAHANRHEQQIADQLRAQMRLDVLWWSEAKYSPSLRRGYRELTPAATTLAMAHDLAQVVPALAPASVTYVLGETIAALSMTDGRFEPQPIEHLLSVLVAEGAEVSQLFSDETSKRARMPLLDLATEAARGSEISPGDVRSRTGVDPALKLTLQEFAMWIFRDLQARRLVEEIK